MKMDMETHRQWFEEYARNKISQCPRDDIPMHLKLQHSRNVHTLAGEIIANEKPDPGLGRICLLAALYHDIARFDQYLQFTTFKDALSFNHGIQALRVLKAEKRLAGEDSADRRIILAAIGLHNRFLLPPHLPKRARFAADVTRDADKLDILRIMDEHLAQKPYNPTVILSLPDDANIFSPKVINAALKRQSASYSDLRCINDFRLLLATWYFNMGFLASKELFVRRGHAQRVVMAIPDNGPHARARDFILEQLASASN